MEWPCVDGGGSHVTVWWRSEYSEWRKDDNRAGTKAVGGWGNDLALSEPWAAYWGAGLVDYQGLGSVMKWRAD